MRPTTNAHPSTAPSAPASSAGGVAAFTSYLLWGVLPLFWKQLDGQSPIELTAHRMVWTMVTVVAFQILRGRRTELQAAWRDTDSRRAHLLNSALLTGNWGIYVWGVSHDRIIEASLGYFLVPLLNVLLGRMLFHEVLTRLQQIAVILAATGVALMIAQVGQVPWIALGLAVTWGCYGTVRKRSHASALNGLALETILATPVALLVIVWLNRHGPTGFIHAGPKVTALMIGSGIISMVPLVLFGFGARRLRLTTLGLLQYVAPTCQFLIGWLVYREPFSREHAGAFVLIWTGLACYSIDLVRTHRRNRQVQRRSFTRPESNAA